MQENKTQPTKKSIDNFLNNLDNKKKQEAKVLIDLMSSVSKQKPILWGESIIGFGSQHYKYDTGREGDMPQIAFSPRKAAITIYFSEGFHHYGEELKKLGKFKNSVSCLYINKLSDIDIKILEKMLDKSLKMGGQLMGKQSTVEEYINRVPSAARPKFTKLRSLVRLLLPDSDEVLSYGIIGYKIGNTRPKIFISAWKDHLAIYPIPKDEKLLPILKKYIKGKGTLWFDLEDELPKKLIEKIVKSLVSK